MLYRGSLDRRRRLTSASISPLETAMSNAGALQAGSVLTQAGLSHSCERPTSISPAPKAQTISVALASKDTMRTLCNLLRRLAPAIENGVAAEYCDRVDRVTQHLIPVERYASQIAGR